MNAWSIEPKSLPMWNEGIFCEAFLIKTILILKNLQWPQKQELNILIQKSMQMNTGEKK